jgi:hypothetical protein
MKVHFLAGMAVVVAACGGEAPQGQESADLTFHQKAQVTIASPAAGSFIAATDDEMVDVAGHASGSSLTVNGASVQVDSGGNFHTRVRATPGINLVEVPLPHLPLANLIAGSTASLGLAAPVNVVVDAVAQRVMLSGDLALGDARESDSRQASPHRMR